MTYTLGTENLACTGRVEGALLDVDYETADGAWTSQGDGLVLECCGL